MKHAIEVLRTAAENAENNAPIHDREGDPAQAELCRAVAAECRAVIRELTPPETVMVTIHRMEKTTYSATVELEPERARRLIDNPDAREHEGELADLCPPTSANWVDSEDTEFTVEEEEDV